MSDNTAFMHGCPACKHRGMPPGKYMLEVARKGGRHVTEALCLDCGSRVELRSDGYAKIWTPQGYQKFSMIDSYTRRLNERSASTRKRRPTVKPVSEDQALELFIANALAQRAEYEEKIAQRAAGKTVAFDAGPKYTKVVK